jgi:hypothetical protein
MAIDFFVLGGPRSATTWAANWLTTDSTFCLHDPLLEYSIRQLDNLTTPGRRIGISCTSSVLYPDWVNGVDVPKVILYRDLEEINRSLRALGLVELEKISHLSRLDAIKKATMFDYRQLFIPSGAKAIADILGVPWDPYRHDLLIQMNVQPQWRTLRVGKQAAKDLIKRIQEAR